MKATDILEKRKNRCIAIILNVKEREVDPLLNMEPGGPLASRLLRKAILDQINDFFEMAVDVVGSSEVQTFEFNPEVWERKIDGKLDEIHRALTSGTNGHH